VVVVVVVWFYAGDTTKGKELKRVMVLMIIPWLE